MIVDCVKAERERKEIVERIKTKAVHATNIITASMKNVMEQLHPDNDDGVYWTILQCATKNPDMIRLELAKAAVEMKFAFENMLALLKEIPEDCVEETELVACGHEECIQ